MVPMPYQEVYLLLQSTELFWKKKPIQVFESIEETQEPCCPLIFLDNRLQEPYYDTWM